MNRPLRLLARALLAAAIVAAIVAGLGPRALGAQGQCNRNGVGQCQIGGNATYAVVITVTRAVRLSLSTANVALDSPGPAEFDAGFGQTTGPLLTVKSNAPWSITIRTTQATWSASPPPARPNKPAGDLQWGTAAAGPFTAISLTNTSLRTGPAATAGTVIPLFFRVAYSWGLDSPGIYNLPVQVTVTSP